MKNLTMNALCSSDELDMMPTNVNESRELKIKNIFNQYETNTNPNQAQLRFFETSNFGHTQIYPTLIEEIKSDDPIFTTLHTLEDRDIDRKEYNELNSGKQAQRKILTRNNTEQVQREALIGGKNNLSMESFGIRE